MPGGSCGAGRGTGGGPPAPPWPGQPETPLFISRPAPCSDRVPLGLICCCQLGIISLPEASASPVLAWGGCSPQPPTAGRGRGGDSLGTASSHSPKLYPAVLSNPAWPARLRTGPRPWHLRAGPSWLGKRQPGARLHPSHSVAALVPHCLPGPPRDKAHGLVCRSPCRLRAGAEPPCLAMFIPNHVPQAHAGSRQRGQDSRRRQGCCRQRVGTSWRGTRSSGCAGCPPLRSEDP